jgi:hypothetical protein
MPVSSGGGCITFGEDWFLVVEVGDGGFVGVGEV